MGNKERRESLPCGESGEEYNGEKEMTRNGDYLGFSSREENQKNGTTFPIPTEMPNRKLHCLVQENAIFLSRLPPFLPLPKKTQHARGDKKLSSNWETSHIVLAIILSFSYNTTRFTLCTIMCISFTRKNKWIVAWKTKKKWSFNDTRDWQRKSRKTVDNQKQKQFRSFQAPRLQELWAMTQNYRKRYTLPFIRDIYQVFARCTQSSLQSTLRFKVNHSVCLLHIHTENNI